MLKKFILVLFLGAFSYAGPFDIEDNFFNATDSAKWTDPGSGVTYYSGPNYEYRFNPSGASSAPWVQFQFPSAKIGCNGLSIKGGFMALLGLKDIKLQLTNAGPTFAWGVLMTIEISMPSVKAVFSEIQKWARKIQSLLGNACQSGQMFGNWMKKEYGFGKFESSILNDGAKDIVSWSQSMETKFDEIMSIDDDDHNDTKEALVTQKLHRVGSGISFFSMNFGKSIGECTKDELDKKEKIDFAIRDIVKNGTIASCDVSGKADFDKKALSYMLSRLLFGELVVTPESLSPILEKFNVDGHFDVEATKRDLKSVVVHNEAPFGEIEYNFLPPIIGDARKAANFLINGSDVAYAVDDTKAIFIKYKSSEASMESYVTDSNGSVSGSSAVFKSPDTTKQLVEIRAIYVTRSKTGDIIDNIKWEGLVEESKKNILKYLEGALKAKTGSVSVSNYFGDIAVPTVDLNTTKTPLLVNGMGTYLNTLVQMSLDKGGIFAAMPLVELLAKYNAELFAEQLLSQIKKQVDEAKTGPGLITNAHTTKGFADFQKRTTIFYNEMQKQIRAMKKETISDIQAIPEIFDKIEMKIKTNRTQKIGK